ncbi:DUF5707 domain-containing protein [Streptomyces sp. NPDC002845]
MSKRILMSSLIGAVALGGIAAGGLAMAASADTEPTVENASVRYTAPSDGNTDVLTFTTDVSDDSGIQSLKVLGWPASSKLDPTEAELQGVDTATCRNTTSETSHCTYSPQATKEEIAELAKGTWYVSVLATAKDGDTTFVPRAATFDVTR